MSIPETSPLPMTFHAPRVVIADTLVVANYCPPRRDSRCSSQYRFTLKYTAELSESVCASAPRQTFHRSLTRDRRDVVRDTERGPFIRESRDSFG